MTSDNRYTDHRQPLPVPSISSSLSHSPAPPSLSIFLQSYHFFLSTRPLINPQFGTDGSFPGGKRPRREAHHPPPSSNGIKNKQKYTPAPTRRGTGTGLPLILPATNSSFFFNSSLFFPNARIGQNTYNIYTPQ